MVYPLTRVVVARRVRRRDLGCIMVPGVFLLQMAVVEHRSSSDSSNTCHLNLEVCTYRWNINLNLQACHPAI